MPSGARLGLYVPTSVMEELPRDLQWDDTVDLVTAITRTVTQGVCVCADR